MTATGSEEAETGTAVTERAPEGVDALPAPVARSDRPRSLRRARVLAAVEAVATLLALLVAIGGALAVIAAPTWQRAMQSVGGEDPLAVTIELLALGTLLVSGATAWFARPGSGLSLVCFSVAAAWMAPELFASPSVAREARSLALLITPLFVPLAIHLPLRALRADRSGAPARWCLIGLYAVTLVVSIGRAITYDPFYIVDCLPTCKLGDNVLLVSIDIVLGARLIGFGLIVGAAASLILVAWSGRRLILRRAWRGPVDAVLASAIVLGMALAWWSATRVTMARPVAVGNEVHDVDAAVGLAVIALATAVTWLLATDMRRGAAVQRVTASLRADGGSCSLSELLSRTLGDPTIRVTFPAADGASCIDERGDPAALPRLQPGRAVTTIERAGQPVAWVEHEAGLDTGMLAREIGAAARLAVDNDRLEAMGRAQLRELRASRARIIAACDAVRGRLERDLHDGAQQRLLAVSLELRLARGAAERAGAEPGELEAAVDGVDRALEDLRELAHGIYPAVLQEAGLEAALRSLAEDAPVPVNLGAMPDGPCAQPSEAAAYFTVMEAVRRAASSGESGIAVEARRSRATLQLALVAGDLGPELAWLRVGDRVAAAGGIMVRDRDPSGAARIRVNLPCA